MITVRPANERGHANHGWLDTWHSFSFADYYDEAHMGFRALRVLNDDTVRPGMGFARHGHRDMEIVSYVLEGALAHKDSMGNGSTIVPGDVQYMSAGTGVRHSEFNASPKEPVHFVQIWILPDRAGYEPRYGQIRVEKADKTGRLRLVASPDGTDGSLAIRQDARLYASVLKEGTETTFALPNGRHLWVQSLRGTVDVNGRALSAGDGLSASDETAFTLKAPKGEAEFLVFDLA
ncbi:MAG TPA: pirin family protein [Thermoanaerobaculia bacterium]|nr:pirin family protein [Thermoanaerobaculia bacterium]